MKIGRAELAYIIGHIQPMVIYDQFYDEAGSGLRLYRGVNGGEYITWQNQEHPAGFICFGAENHSF